MPVRILICLLACASCAAFAFVAGRAGPGILRRIGAAAARRATAIAPLVFFCQPGYFKRWLAAAPFVAGAAVLAAPMFGTVWALVGLLLVVMFAFSRLSKREDKLQEALRRQLPDAMEAMATNAAARASIPSAMRDVASSAQAPLKEVFADVIGSYDRAVVFHEALHNTAVRVRNRELNLAFEIVSVCFRQGSALDEVSRRLGTSLRSLQAFRTKIQNETSGARMGMRIMLVLPVAVLIMMSSVEGEAVSQMFSTPVGIILVLAAGLFLIMSWLWGRSILRSYV